MKRSKDILLASISLTLFLGGVILLLSHIEFWSLFLGLPATQVGIILLILSFERISKKSLDEDIADELKEPKEEEEDDTD